VYGLASSGDGVYGQSDTGNGVRGLSENSYGVFGFGKNSHGVNGQSWHSDGVRGFTSSNDSSDAGVLGEAFGPAMGVRGLAGSGDGVRGDSETGDGVHGASNNGNGLYGFSHHGSGVYGTSPNGGGVAGYSLHGNGVSGFHTGDEIEGAGVYGYSTNGPAFSGRSDSEILLELHDTNERRFLVDAGGDVHADGTYLSPAADFAEMLPASDGLEPGDVLVIGSDGRLTRSDQAYQATVVGVYSTEPGYLGGGANWNQDGYVPLAVVGVVPVKASAENGPIAPGDLLVASSIPGHAMRCQGVGLCFGRTIGKALGELQDGTGLITMLVILQ
jgi:hypothetical protein